MYQKNFKFQFYSLMTVLLMTIVSSTFSQIKLLHSRHSRPYTYRYQVDDAAAGVQYEAQQSSDGQVVQGQYSVRLPGESRRDRAFKRYIYET